MYDTLCERGAFFHTHMKVVKSERGYRILYPITWDELIEAGMMKETDFSPPSHVPPMRGRQTVEQFFLGKTK